MALMVLVNNPGNWDATWAPLHHAAWNGLTVTDLVFPTFMFVMGVSMYFSLSKGGFKLSWKILRRTLLLIGIGLILNWLSGIVYGHGAGLSHLRFTGVLQRFGLSFGLAAVLVCTIPHKGLKWVILGLLGVYSAILLLWGGYIYGPDNIIARVDRFLISQNHLYNDNGIDPEGILSTIPSVAHVLLGFLVGKFVAGKRNREALLTGCFLLVLGAIAAIWLPLNKKIWSPSFVLVVCGIGTLALCLLYFLADEKGIWKKAGFFKAFGTNAIYCYVTSHLVGWTFYLVGIQRWYSIGCASGFDGLIPTSPASLALMSLAYAIFCVCVSWLTVLPLYKKGICVKV